MIAKADDLNGLSSHIFCAKIIEITQTALQFWIVSGIEPIEVMRFVYINATMLHSVG